MQPTLKLMMGTLALLALVALVPAGNAASASASGSGSCVKHGYTTNGVYLWTLRNNYYASASYGALDLLAVATASGSANGAPSYSATSSWLTHPGGATISGSNSYENGNAHYADSWGYNAYASVSALTLLTPVSDSDSNFGSCV
ncbi:MAG: hypothetical protein QOI63_62 [Thermoplasmata archaeon]|jgi:hypothetical protein|nr:hypothetical protein [Thermoplasmata archaeon]